VATTHTDRTGAGEILPGDHLTVIRSEQERHARDFGWINASSMAAGRTASLQTRFLVSSYAGPSAHAPLSLARHSSDSDYMTGLGKK
jgi:hypothetical protein